MPSPVHDRLADLVAQYQLPSRASEQFAALLDLVASEPSSVTSVRDPMQGVDVHIADSLVALELDVMRRAERLADLGSGAGFPGLALAIALPDLNVALVESVTRKCAFLERAAACLELGNVHVVAERVEAWREGLASRDVVTARALAPLAVILEYAAPLLTVGGSLVAWKGRIDLDEKADANAAAATLGMSEPAARTVEPFPHAGERALYVSSKVRTTPPQFPRREGMARKRPLRASSRR